MFGVSVVQKLKQFIRSPWEISKLQVGSVPDSEFDTRATDLLNPQLVG